MLSPLANSAYRHLFAAQVSALLGTELATIALGLLAHDLAGAQAAKSLAPRWRKRGEPAIGLSPCQLLLLLGRGPRPRPPPCKRQTLTFVRRSEFAITETDDRAIAAAAIIGDKRSPVSG